MKIEGVIWLRAVVDKLVLKHHVQPQEVEEVLSNKPKFRRIEKAVEQGKMCIGRWGRRMQEGTSRCCSSTRERIRL